MKCNASAIVSTFVSTFASPRRAAPVVSVPVVSVPVVSVPVVSVPVVSVPVVSVTLLAGVLATVVSACGYHAAGHSDLLPKTIQSVCIPAFRNASMKYKLADRLPEALSMEFIARTRYHITTDCANADAVLNGSVNNYIYYPTVYDPATGRASAVDMRLYLTVALTERATKKVLFTRANLEVRERYEISVDPRAYFDESDAGLARVAKTVAQQLVSAILENF